MSRKGTKHTGRKEITCEKKETQQHCKHPTGMIWISMGLTRTMAEKRGNIALFIIGDALIALSISVLKRSLF
ncbi:MAG TPA: hypothetical protein DHM90_12715 [Clostridiaceae bacterium]|nr:hypothetical protein [Clostridiaceae bacterium]